MAAFGLWHGGSHMGFGTHLPLLAAAVMRAQDGPVLEYGLGFYSTPMLDMLCREMKRELVSLEGDPGWAAGFMGLHDPPAHTIQACRSSGDWASTEHLTERMWAVVFIDHGPDERRVVDARRLHLMTDIMVVHDWDPNGTFPWQEEIKGLFKYYQVSRCGPHTAILSSREVTLW